MGWEGQHDGVLTKTSITTTKGQSYAAGVFNTNCSCGCRQNCWKYVNHAEYWHEVLTFSQWLWSKMNNVKTSQQHNDKKKSCFLLSHIPIHHIPDVFHLSEFNPIMPQPFNSNFIMKQPKSQSRKQEKFLCPWWHSSKFIRCIEVVIVLLCCLVRSDWPQHRRNMEIFELDFECTLAPFLPARQGGRLPRDGGILRRTLPFSSFFWQHLEQFFCFDWANCYICLTIYVYIYKCTNHKVELIDLLDNFL